MSNVKIVGIVNAEYPFQKRCSMIDQRILKVKKSITQITRDLSILG